MTPPDHENKPDNLGTILNGKRSAGGDSILLARRGLELPATVEAGLTALLKQLEAESEGPIVLTVLSNAECLAMPAYAVTDAAWGERLAMQCRACHSLDAGGRRTDFQSVSK